MWRWIRTHALSLALFALLAAMLTTLLVMAPSQYRAEGVTGIPWWQWWAFVVVLSLVADVFGLLLYLELRKYLPERDAPDAKDPPDE